MRILGIDPGEKRIGVAISDPTGTIANPVTVIKHISRAEDAAAIIAIAVANQVERIIIGQSLDEEGMPNPQGRSAARLAEVIRELINLPVELWDESGSTQTARAARISMGVSRKKRRGHLDEIAATVILQSYLDARINSEDLIRPE
jgi:putative holliday junction resolvase